MKIIFEGLDNCGKDTQIKLLREYFYTKGFVITKSSNINVKPEIYKEIAKKEYSQIFKLFNQNIDIICNRLHGGETVYGEIYRNYSGDYVYDLEKQYNLDKIDDLYLIVLIDEPKNLLKREDGKSISIDFDKKVLEKEKFEKFYEKSIIKNKILIDVNNKPIEKIFKIILSFLGDKNENF